MSEDTSRTRSIKTNHFHGNELPISAVCFALAGQEGNDGDEGNTLQAAGQYIKDLELKCATLEVGLINIINYKYHGQESMPDIARNTLEAARKIA